MIVQWGPGPFPSASVADVRKNLQCGSALVPNKSGQKAEAGLDQANRGPWTKSGPPPVFVTEVFWNMAILV